MQDDTESTPSPISADSVLTLGGTIESAPRETAPAPEAPAAAPPPPPPPAPDFDHAETQRRLKSLISSVSQVSMRTDEIDRTCVSLRDSVLDRIDEVNGTLQSNAGMLTRLNSFLLLMLVTAALTAVGFMATIYLVVSSYGKLSDSVNNLALNMQIDEESGTSVTAAQINHSLREVTESVDELYRLAAARDAAYGDQVQQQKLALMDSSDALRNHMDTRLAQLNEQLESARMDRETTVTQLLEVGVELRKLQDASRAGTSRMDQLLSMREQVAALVELERARYLDLVSAQLDAAERLVAEEEARTAAANQISYRRGDEATVDAAQPETDAGSE